MQADGFERLIPIIGFKPWDKNYSDDQHLEKKQMMENKVGITLSLNIAAANKFEGNSEIRFMVPEKELAQLKAGILSKEF